MNSFIKNALLDWQESSKRPFLAMVFFVLLISVWNRGITTISKEEFSGLFIVLFLFAAVLVYKNRILGRKLWIYYIIQGIIVFDIAVIMKAGFEVAYIGLLPILIYESLLDFEEKGYVLLTVFLYYGIFSGLIIYMEGVELLINFLPILGLTTFAVMTFNGMYQKQIELRIRSQKMTFELQEANMKIEGLTLERERQRVARDLHDTLSQGLSALVMYMETMEVYLNQGKEENLKAVISKATDHARLTLAEARQVLEDLRAYDQHTLDFRKMLYNEVDRFNELYSGKVTVEAPEAVAVEEDIARQLKFVGREILTNIQRHAKSSTVTVFLHQSDQQLHFRITDDGVGVDTRRKWGNIGHYGLLGMEERIRNIGGQFKIYSQKRKGTTVDIVILNRKGEDTHD